MLGILQYASYTPVCSYGHTRVVSELAPYLQHTLRESLVRRELELRQDFRRLRLGPRATTFCEPINGKSNSGKLWYIS